MSGTGSTIVSKVVTVGVIGTNAGVALGGQEVLTASGLEDMVIFGVTYGAWVMFLLAFSLLVIVVRNLIGVSLDGIKLSNEWRSGEKKASGKTGLTGND